VPLSQTPTSTTNTAKTPLIDLSTLVAILSSSKLPTTFDDSPSHAQSTIIPITSPQTCEASSDHKETKIEEVSESSLPPVTTTSRTNELMSQLIDSFVNNRKFEQCSVETTTATKANNEPIVAVVEPAVVVITTTIASKPPDVQITPKGSTLINESRL
jgi:hypothetical protein